MSFGTAITAQIGADVGDLQAKATFVEAAAIRMDKALSKIGIGGESRTDKSAADSAAALQQLLAAQEALASFRARTALADASFQQRAIILEQERRALVIARNQAEAGTITRLQAELALGEKIAQINRNQGAILQQIAGGAKAMPAVMDESVKKSESFLSNLKKIGLGFIGLTSAVNVFRSIVQHARDLEGPLDANQKRAKEFAQSVDAIKTGMLDIGVQALGTLNTFGGWVGRQIAIARYGREQVELNERIAADTEETVKRMEEAKAVTLATNAAKAEGAALDAKIVAARAPELTAAQRRNKLEQEYLDLLRQAVNEPDRVKRIQAENAAKEKQLEYIAAEKEAEAELQASIKAGIEQAAEARSKADADAKAAMEEMVQLARKQAEGEAQAVEIAKAKVVQLKEVLAIQNREFSNQIAMRTLSKLGLDDVQGANDAALEEQRRRSQRELLALGAGGGGLAFDDNYFKRIQIGNDISRLTRELEMRDTIRTDVSRYGVEGARQFFEGDPLLYDKLVQEFTQQRDKTDATNAELRSINAKLKSGLDVRNLGQ